MLFLTFWALSVHYTVTVKILKRGWHCRTTSQFHALITGILKLSSSFMHCSRVLLPVMSVKAARTWLRGKNATPPAERKHTCGLWLMRAAICGERLNPHKRSAFQLHIKTLNYFMPLSYITCFSVLTMQLRTDNVPLAVRLHLNISQMCMVELLIENALFWITMWGSIPHQVRMHATYAMNIRTVAIECGFVGNIVLWFMATE